MKWKGNIEPLNVEMEKMKVKFSKYSANVSAKNCLAAFAVLVFSLLLNSSVYAQSSFTQSRSISIGVAVGLSIYVNRALNFGTVVAGTGVHSVAVTDANTGKVTISGQWNRTVYVTLTPPASLVNGSDSLAYTPGAAYNNTADNPSAATVWASPTGRQAGFKLRANRSGSTGKAFVYIFGSINVVSVPPGNYSGTYVVAVSYF